MSETNTNGADSTSIATGNSVTPDLDADVDPNAPLLAVEDATVEYQTNDEVVTAVDGVSFQIDTDEMFGLVGESGCGKSTLAKAILKLLPDSGQLRSGEIRFKGISLGELSKAEFDHLRWEHISLISQGAMNSLNPVLRISTQIIEAIQAHRDVSKADARDRVAELFNLVGLNPDRMDEYPHQYSGGMKQRAYIAMAIALEPDLIVADEPTTALDVITQDQILKHLKQLRDELDVSLLIISHDISVIAETCDRLGIMYAGKFMEYGNLKSIFGDTYNPYTMGLKNAFPTISYDDTEIIEIPGVPPDLSEPVEGCRFQPRCPYAVEECGTAHPPVEEVAEDHYSACYRHADVGELRSAAKRAETWEDQSR